MQVFCEIYYHGQLISAIIINGYGVRGALIGSA